MEVFNNKKLGPIFRFFPSFFYDFPISLIEIFSSILIQSPFWFLTRPEVENLLDDEGRILSNKVRQNSHIIRTFSVNMI